MEKSNNDIGYIPKTPKFTEEEKKELLKKREELLSWLWENDKVLSHISIEDTIGMPRTTLHKATRGIQKLPIKWIQPLYDWRIKLCKHCKPNPDSNE